MAEEKNIQNSQNSQSSQGRNGGKRPFKGRRPYRGKRPQDRAEKPERAEKAEKSETAQGEELEAQKQRKPQNSKRPQERKGNPQHQQREGKRQQQSRPPRQDNPRRVDKELGVEMLLTDEQKAFAQAKDILLEKPIDENGEAIENSEPQVEIVGIRFKKTGKIYYFAPLDIKFEAGDGVIVETTRGQEYGTVALANRMVNDSETSKPLKPVIRKATEADTEHHIKNKEVEKHATEIWDELVARHGLQMSLTDVEYTFDEAKLVFYFTADGRVDFRELVKDLASMFRTRIELRQIGVRDEAKLVGGLGVCGMPFCCNRFLPDFVQVSIKMAKEQNLSLSSSKISGNCGRLMCCLRYEQDVYECEYKTFPRPDMIVQTAQGRGVITESNFLNGKIKVRMDGDGTPTVKTFTRDEVKVIARPSHSHKDSAVDKELKKLED